MSTSTNEKYRSKIKEIKSRLERGDDYSPPAAQHWVESKPPEKKS